MKLKSIWNNLMELKSKTLAVFTSFFVATASGLGYLLVAIGFADMPTGLSIVLSYSFTAITGIWLGVFVDRQYGGGE